MKTKTQYEFCYWDQHWPKVLVWQKTFNECFKKQGSKLDIQEIQK